MIGTLNTRLSTVAAARRMIAIPLLVIALAAMAALPYGTAYADGGQPNATQQSGTQHIDSISTGQCLLPGIPC